MYDKDMFPCFHEDAQPKRACTTYFEDFLKKGFNDDANKAMEVFSVLFENAKKDIRLLTELCAACNNYGWKLYGENQDNPVANVMFNGYHICMDFAFGDNNPYTDDERSFMFGVID